MSNLYKYIQTINESDNSDSDSDQTAIEYEKYIYLGFKYLKQKTEFQQKELLKREEEINKENLVKTLHSIKKDELDNNDVIKQKITKIGELTNNYKEIGKSPRMNSKDKKIAKEKKFNEIKNLSIELVIDIKDQIEKNGKLKQITQPQYIKRLTKELEKKLKDIEEIEILNNMFSEDENINDNYKKALFICKHFLWTVVSNKNSEKLIKDENLFDIHDYSILEVEHIGGQYFPIHDNWRRLYPTDKPALEEDEFSIETDKNLSNKKGTTKSVGKTDIFLHINSKKYNLSLKNINAQLATPTYVDIYILFMYGIDSLLRRILMVFKKTKDYKSINKNLLKTISDQAENIIKNMEIDRRTYIDKLKNQISITEKKTNEYITNVTCAMLFELFVEKMNSFNEELNKENDQKKTIEDRMREYLQKDKINSSEIKSRMEDVAKDLDRLFIDIKNISSIDNMDNILKSLLEDDIKEIKIDQEKNKDLLESLTEKQTERRNKIKTLLTNINIDSLKDEIKLLLLEFKTLPLLKDRLKKLDIDKSEDRYNKTFESIKRLLKGEIKGGKTILASKEDEYELAFNLKDSTKKANNQFIDFFKNDNNNILEILGDLDEIHKNLKQIILKNKKIIKEEILKETITGLYKFTGSTNFNNNNKAVATHIFEFDHTDKKHLIVTPINSSSNLKKFIRSLNINNDKIFNFAVKGSGSKSYIALRIKAIFKKITNENISYDGLNYEYDIYTEGFITNLVDKVKENIDNVFDDFKIKILKTTMFLKGKSVKLLNLFGLEVKIDKNMKLPKWIVDKL